MDRSRRRVAIRLRQAEEAYYAFRFGHSVVVSEEHPPVLSWWDSLRRWDASRLIACIVLVAAFAIQQSVLNPGGADVTVLWPIVLVFFVAWPAALGALAFGQTWGYVAGELACLAALVLAVYDAFAVTLWGYGEICLWAGACVAVRRLRNTHGRARGPVDR